MTRFAATIALILALLAGPLMAQTDDRGVLQAFLEDNLSDAGREVRIEGFEGALSGRATLRKLTIADSRGVWLTMTDAVLDWNRGSLLRGELDIAELSAKSLVIARQPLTAPGPPAPEAAPFSLPDLPVSIRIGSLKIARLVLGAPLLGKETVLTVDGSAELAEGAGRARLSVLRVGGPEGRLQFSGAFSNATRQLELSLDLTEAPGGIAATLLGLPGQPAVAFGVKGAGPIDDFTARIALSTDGESRLGGTVSLGAAPDPAAPEQSMRRFRADLGGDLRPLFEPQYRAFLGAEQRLVASGQRRAGGALELEQLSLRADAMSLEGRLYLSADGWPQRVELTGRIAPVEGSEVLLALPGPQTRISGATLRLFHDAEAGDTWTLSATLADLRRPGLSLDAAQISGEGRLQTDLQRVAGKLALDLSGLRPDDRDLARATGPSLTGGLTFDWTRGGALQLSSIELDGQDYALAGQARIEGVEGQVDLSVDTDLQLDAQDLGRFSGLAGRDLGGSASLRIKGRVMPVSGAFDLTLSGSARDLTSGEPRLDPLISGTSQLSLAARRDTGGTALDLSLKAPAATVSAGGTLASDASDLSFALTLRDAGLVVPGASGPAGLTGTAIQAGDIWRLRTSATAPGEATAEFQGNVRLIDGAAGRFKGDLTLAIGNLSAYAALAGRPIGGAFSVTASAAGDLRDGTIAAEIAGTGRNLAAGLPELDLLLRGESTLAAALRRDADGVFFVDRAELRTPQASAEGAGFVGAASARASFALGLDNLGLLVPGLNGPLTANGVLTAQDGPWTIDSALQGPGGAKASVRGQIARDGATANLAIAGAGPLALANRFIAPNLAEGSATFDLGLNGAPGLGALSGVIRTSGARVTLPGARLALTGLSAEARIAGGTAQLDAMSNVSAGGRLTLAGNVGLTAPYAAELTAGIAGLVVSRPGLFETVADGRLAVAGPLTGGALISGDIALGLTEIRVPDGAAAGSGTLTGLVHLNEPAAVRQTRLRAGLIEQSKAGSGARHGLDLTINAPSRVFLRGRGLDAELGGSLRVFGDTGNVATEGRFDLIRGRLDILGKRLVLSEASARLQGDFDPYIRAVGTTDADGTRVQVIVEGLASSPQVSFLSTPDLPEDEILARLLFGRNLSRISPLQALQIANAIRVLAGQGGEGIVERLRQGFGLDDLDITTDETGGAGLRVGKYINENISAEVTVDTTGKSEINLNLSLTPSVTARGSVSSDGNTGVGLFFERDY